MTKGVIFDLGNTLMFWDGKDKDIEAQSNAVLAKFLNANGIPVGEDFIPLFRAARREGWKQAEETNLEHTVEEALTAALAQLGHLSQNGLLAHAVEQFFKVGEVWQRLYPETLEALEELNRRGLRVGLISNADDDALVQRASIRLGIAPFLSPTVSSAGLRWRKPNPSIFKYVADLWNLPPHEIAMVGDAPKYDILGAHRAGMKGILIDRGEGHWWQQVPEEFANEAAIRPDTTITSLLDLLEWLNH
jgi:putative hydrolase of the HAD superfamily